MNTTVRWTLFGLALAVNAVASVLLHDTWQGITVNVVSGLIVVGLLAEYFLHARRR